MPRTTWWLPYAKARASVRAAVADAAAGSDVRGVMPGSAPLRCDPEGRLSERQAAVVGGYQPVRQHLEATLRQHRGVRRSTRTFWKTPPLSADPADSRARGGRLRPGR